MHLNAQQNNKLKRPVSAVVQP